MIILTITTVKKLSTKCENFTPLYWGEYLEYMRRSNNKNTKQATNQHTQSPNNWLIICLHVKYARAMVAQNLGDCQTNFPFQQRLTSQEGSRT